MLTVRQVAERLAIHRDTAAELVRSGTFPAAWRCGRDWRVPVSDVLAYVAARQAFKG